MSIAPEYVPSDATIDSGEDPNIPSGSGRQSGRSSGGTTIGGGGIQSIGTPLQQLGITTKKAKTKKFKSFSDFLEGYAGIKTVFNLILESLKANEEYYAFSLGEELKDKNIMLFLPKLSSKAYS